MEQDTRGEQGEVNLALEYQTGWCRHTIDAFGQWPINLSRPSSIRLSQKGKSSLTPRAIVRTWNIIRMRQCKDQKCSQSSIGAGVLKCYYPPESPMG